MTIAHDGAVAAKAVMRRAFDVIVSDIDLPGMTGVDLLRVVRAYDLDVPLILMTGAPSIDTATEAVSLGALEYLRKPFPNDVLLKAVEHASRLHRMAEIKRDALQLLGESGRRRGIAPDSKCASRVHSIACGWRSSRSSTCGIGQSTATRR